MPTRRSIADTDGSEGGQPRGCPITDSTDVRLCNGWSISTLITAAVPKARVATKVATKANSTAAAPSS